MSKIIKVVLRRSLAFTTHSQPDIIVFSSDEFQSMNLTKASINIDLKYLDKTLTFDMINESGAIKVFNKIIEQMEED